MNNQYGILLEHPLSKLSIVGVFTSKSGYIKTSLSIVHVSCVTIIVILSFMQFFYMKNSILDFVDQAEAFSSMSQTFLKLVLSFWQKHKFLNLCKYSAKFWNTENCSEETKKRIENLSKNILLMQKSFFYACMICIIAIMLSVFSGRKLPLGTWNMTEHHILYKIDFIATIIAYILNIFYISSFDCLFVGFCCEVGNQFQILYDHLEHLNDEEAQCEEDLINKNKKLNFYIRQHSFLLRYFKKMQDTYSVTLMIQCLTVVPIICAEIVALSQDINYILMFRYGLSMYCVFVQIAFYCIPAEYVTSQAATISNGIYNSKWYLKNRDTKKSSILMMTQISQQEIILFAMGMIPIKASTLVTIYKIAMSTRTLISNLDEK